MKRILSFLLLFIPLLSFGQSEKVSVIVDSSFANRWGNMGKNWRYQKGDNLAWAKPEFNDASWKEFSGSNLNMPDGKHAIANSGEIVWFRKYIKADSSLNDAIVLSIYQSGASEIYLDGVLIGQLGKVGKSSHSFVNTYSSEIQLLQLPLSKGKEQVFAVRFVNYKYRFPIYSNISGIRILATSLKNTNSKDVVSNYNIAGVERILRYNSAATGISVLMFIIFLSFFLFFPKEKINGYFALSSLFLIFFTLTVLWSSNVNENLYWMQFASDACMIISAIILLYCTYQILEQPIDAIFKIVTGLGLVSIGLFILYDPDVVAPLWGILALPVIIRVALKAWNKNRIGASIFIISCSITLLFWVLYLLNQFGILTVSYIFLFIPFAFMVNPVALAIYLGYSFGKRSEELRLNLDRVQNLSKEKEAILNAQNETLEKQVKERTASLNQSLENLKSTQTQLIQSEKMASLGELTAGIAHEIQNPLNFVNNFSEVSMELIDELEAERLKAESERDSALEGELLADIKQNLGKISHHGKRADFIVKGMLQHSRTSTGERQPTNLNTLADEFLKLSYHGLRAKDKSFNAELVTNFDPALPKIQLVQQDIGRVLLNLFNNAFYAVQERRKAEGEGFKPTVEVSTTSRDGIIEISVKDNGSGIPDAIKEKIMQPFFTTKPTGEGTGLGLSLSYDIVKAHGGEIKVNSQEGIGSEFIIHLPVN